MIRTTQFSKPTTGQARCGLKQCYAHTPLAWYCDISKNLISK